MGKKKQPKDGVFDIAEASMSACKAVREYCREDGITRCDYTAVIQGLRARDFSEFTDADWFMLFDALGTRDELSANAKELYVLASYVWYMAVHFRGLTADSTRRRPARRTTA